MSARKKAEPLNEIIPSFRLAKKWADQLYLLARQDDAALGVVGALVRRYVIEGIKREAI